MKYEFDNENAYNKEFEIYSYETDLDYKATLVYFLKIIQEASGHHAYLKGLSVPVLNKDNNTWVVLRTLIDFTSIPAWPSRIKVRTASLTPNLFYFLRQFSISLDDKVFAKGSSVWTIIDKDKFRPQKPQTYVEKFGEFSGEVDLDIIKKPRKSYDITGFDLIVKEKLKPSFTDIDYNKHVNNVAYLNWVMQRIPFDIVKSYLFTFLDISWVKQTFLNDEITLNLYRKEDTLIFHLTNEDLIVCQGELRLKAR